MERSATATSSRTIRALVLASVLSILVFPTQATDETDWIPRTLSTTPPVVQPLGCRQNESQQVCSPTVDVSDLPEVGKDVEADVNPYRGNAAAASIGQKLFNQTCAYCHGRDADNTGAIGADLTRIGSGCNQVADKALHQRCERDVNAYFVDRVRNGKVTFGIVMMPPWGGVLSEKDIWAIKAFLESRSPQ
ncbi:MAG: c-type cytochrome [Pseudoxanthomonas sp.]